MTATRTESSTAVADSANGADTAETGPAATDAIDAASDSATEAGDERAETGTADSDSARPPGKRAWIALGVLVVLLASTIVSGVLWLSGRAAETEQRAAMDAARSAAVALTSINFGTAEQDIQRVVDGGTGEFGDLFRQNLDPYVRMVRDSQVTSRGDVTAIGLSRWDARSAEVVVAMRGEVRNASSPEAQQRLYRMRLDMTKEGDRWLVSKLEFVG